MSINGGEWVVLIVLVLVLLGPDRLPEYARTLARLVRSAREFAQRAQEQVRAEIGPEFDDIDWQKYDPRRYHPRTIVRNALQDAFTDDDDPAPGPATAKERPAARTIRTASNGAPSGPARPDFVKPVSPGAPDPAVASPPARPAASPSRAPRNPRPAPLRAAGVASPPPSTWEEAARRSGMDVDAT